MQRLGRLNTHLLLATRPAARDLLIPPALSSVILNQPSVSSTGPSDRQPEHVRRQELGHRLQAARRPDLPAAPAALAVVLRPAGALLARLLVASRPHGRKLPRTDERTFVQKQTQEIIVFLLSNTCFTFISLSRVFLFDCYFVFFNGFSSLSCIAAVVYVC